MPESRFRTKNGASTTPAAGFPVQARGIRRPRKALPPLPFGALPRCVPGNGSQKPDPQRKPDCPDIAQASRQMPPSGTPHAPPNPPAQGQAPPEPPPSQEETALIHSPEPAPPFPDRQDPPRQPPGCAGAYSACWPFWRWSRPHHQSVHTWRTCAGKPAPL